MPTMPLHEAQTDLAGVVERLQPGEELVLTADGRPLAKLVRADADVRPRRAGSAKDRPHWMADDFNAPMDEFGEYTG